MSPRHHGLPAWWSTGDFISPSGLRSLLWFTQLTSATVIDFYVCFPFLVAVIFPACLVSDAALLHQKDPQGTGTSMGCRHGEASPDPLDVLV